MLTCLLPKLGVAILLLLISRLDAFVFCRGQEWQSSTTVLRSLGNNSPIPADAALPRDVKEAVSKCRASVQEALRARLSRIDIEMPVGTKFGIEKIKNKKGQSRRKDKTGAIEDNDKLQTLSQLETSDRELARLFVEMFQPLGGNHIAVVFATKDLAETAETNWRGDPSSSSRVLWLDRRQNAKNSSAASNMKKKAIGFASKLAAEIDGEPLQNGKFELPEGTEVALFVAPGPKELVVIERICREVGMGTLVVLLNARLSSIDKFGTPASKSLFLNEFEPVFHLRAAPQQEAPDCLLYRSYPNDWVLARKPKVGIPKVILVQKSCPTGDECHDALQREEISGFEKNVGTLLEGVAGWFS